MASVQSLFEGVSRLTSWRMKAAGDGIWYSIGCSMVIMYRAYVEIDLQINGERGRFTDSPLAGSRRPRAEQDQDDERFKRSMVA